MVNWIANTGNRNIESLFETLKLVFEDIFDIYHLTKYILCIKYVCIKCMPQSHDSDDQEAIFYIFLTIMF